MKRASLIGSEIVDSDVTDETVVAKNPLFCSLSIKCVVQLELIQSIDNIVFYPSTSRKEDAETLQLVANDFDPNSKREPDLQHEEQGMYRFLSTEHLIKLIECLMQSHRFAKTFNADSEQRNILWKAGFRGAVRPNLLKQETQSLACVLRVLLKIYSDESRQDDWPDIENKLIIVNQEALKYFLQLTTDCHRDAWTSLLLLILTRVLKMPDHRVSFFTAFHPY